MIDYHLHTRLCKHASGEIEAYVEKAISLGIKEIAFTDHNPFDDGFDSAHRMERYELDLYLSWIASVRKSYPEIKILTGIEADYYRGYETFLERFLGEYEFDLVLLSVHFVHGWPDGSWVFKHDLPGKSMRDIYTEYLSEVTAGIRTGLFDCLSHADLIKYNGRSLTQVVPDQVNSLLTEIKNAGMAMEINSSGYRKVVGEPYPALDWLPLIKKAGIPLVIGSDAHAPDQVGLRFTEVYESIKNAGITTMVSFDKRKMSPYEMEF